MPKMNGLGGNFAIGGYNVSGDVAMIDKADCPQEPIDVTGLDKFAYERIGGKRDGNIDFTSHFNTTAGQAHTVLGALPTTDQYVTWFLKTTAGSPAYSMGGRQINYDISRGDDGKLAAEVSVQGDGFGGEWGVGLTGSASSAFRASTGAENLPSVNDAAATTTHGLTAYLHVVAFTGTSVTATIQQSDDDGVGDPYFAVAAFAAASAVGAQRITVADGTSVEKWLRVVLSGTYSAATVAINLIRHQTAVVY